MVVVFSSILHHATLANSQICESPSLVPRPHPDFILQHGCEIKSGQHGCEIKSGWGLGTRLDNDYGYESLLSTL